MKKTKKINDYNRLVKIMFKSGLIDSLSPTRQEFNLILEEIINLVNKKIKEI